MMGLTYVDERMDRSATASRAVLISCAAAIANCSDV